jgi:flagellar basal-body rod protein FlgB
MAIGFNSALGIHEQALYLREQRSTVLGNNLANVDTPNFKARDVDFSRLLDQAKQQSQTSTQSLRRTDARHLSFGGANNDEDLLYTVPSQPSIDGNTVEEHREMARYAKNTMDFEASFYFLNSKFKGLQSAITGQ